MKNEFYDIAFRKKIYHSLEQLQQDVDEWLRKYNEYRPHSGSRCYGKTPMQTFNDAKELAQEAQLENHFEKDDNEQVAVVEVNHQSEQQNNLYLSDNFSA